MYNYQKSSFFSYSFWKHINQESLGLKIQAIILISNSMKTDVDVYGGTKSNELPKNSWSELIRIYDENQHNINAIFGFCFSKDDIQKAKLSFVLDGKLLIFLLERYYKVI